MAPAMFLPDNLRNSAVAQPFLRQKLAAAVGRLFFQAGRFKQRQFTQSFQHLRQPFAQVGEEGKRGHGKGMVARLARRDEMGAAGSGPRRQNVKLSGRTKTLIIDGLRTNGGSLFFGYERRTSGYATRHQRDPEVPAAPVSVSVDR